MVLRFELVQKQTQKLILSPQMQQAIKLLQLPLLQLQQLVRQEMQQNPVLEEDPLQEEEHEQEQVTEERPDDGEIHELTFEEEFNRLAKIDDEWKEYFRQSSTFRRYSQEDEEKRRFLEASIVKPETLQENLLKQLGLSMLDEKQRKICTALIGNIDDNGYLDVDIRSIATQLRVSIEEVEQMVALIQTLSPVGVGARNLRECLLIQLSRLVPTDSLAYKIVGTHLEELSKKKYPQIARALRITTAQVQKAAEIIATLEPKPGRLFSNDTAQYIIPDVFVEKEDEEYTIILNDDRIPHLRISNFYREMMRSEDSEKKTKSYIKNKIKAGQWLLRNIQQRQHTIYNIANEIVNKQKEFFDDGLTQLKPLTMQEVADSLGIHESTVSRAIANKYIQTPHGLFDMKYFFSTGITSPSGENVSVTNIKRIIRYMIDHEDPKKPLSDQEIIEKLKEKNIVLARRTIAKYRKEFGILPSNLRRKF